jgi:phage tail sheath gpL-like
VANASAASKVVSVFVGDKGIQVNTTDDLKSANDVAAAIKAALAELDIPFVATVSSAVVTLTAKAKGASYNNIAVTGSTTDTTQTVTVADGTSGADAILNPGWFARSTAEQADDLVIVDLG